MGMNAFFIATTYKNTKEWKFQDGVLLKGHADMIAGIENSLAIIGGLCVVHRLTLSSQISTLGTCNYFLTYVLSSNIGLPLITFLL